MPNEILRKSKTWKAGPVDLLWDNKRGVWTCHDYIVGYLNEDILPGESGKMRDEKRGINITVHNFFYTAIAAGAKVLVGYVASAHKWYIIHRFKLNCCIPFGLLINIYGYVYVPIEGRDCNYCVKIGMPLSGTYTASYEIYWNNELIGTIEGVTTTWSTEVWYDEDCYNGTGETSIGCFALAIPNIVDYFIDTCDENKSHDLNQVYNTFTGNELRVDLVSSPPPHECISPRARAIIRTIGFRGELGTDENFFACDYINIDASETTIVLNSGYLVSLPSWFYFS